MVRGIVSGFTRGMFLRYRLTKPSSSVVCPPTQLPVTMAVLWTQLRRPLDAGIGDGFARGHGGELSEAVQQADFFFVEITRRIVIPHFGGVLKTQQAPIDAFERRDSGTPLRQSLPEFATIVAQRRDDAQAGDDHAVGHGSGIWPEALRSGPDRGLASLALIEQLGDPFHHVAHRANALRRVVGNIDVELALHREKNIDPVQRIDPQFLERAVGRHLLLRKVLGGRNDSSDPLGQLLVGHKISVTFSK